MEMPAPGSEPGSAELFKRLAHRVFITCENRFQLLLVEVQEERERLLRSIWLGLAAAVFGLLAGVTLTLVVALAFWNHSPVIALLALLAVYAIGALLCYARLVKIQKDWETLSATIEQLRKDRECLEKQMA